MFFIDILFWFLNLINFTGDILFKKTPFVKFFIHSASLH